MAMLARDKNRVATFFPDTVYMLEDEDEIKDLGVCYDWLLFFY